MTWLLALPLLLVGALCWAVIGYDLWRYMRRRNRYVRRSVWDQTKDPRDWSKQYMDSLKQGRF